VRFLAGQIKKCLDKLSYEDIWWRPRPGQNSVGNLVLHLTGNLRQRVNHVIGDQADVRQRELEFSTEGGPSGEELWAGLNHAVEEAMAIVSGLDEEQLQSPSRWQPEPRTKLEAFLLVALHFALHTGQIIAFTRMRTVIP
jgi:hypothetical protein